LGDEKQEKSKPVRYGYSAAASVQYLLFPPPSQAVSKRDF